MDFTQSLEYTFNRRNLPKILTIALAAVLIGVSVFVVAALFESLWIAALIIPVLLGYVVFVYGYTISIIKSVMDGSDRLPSIAFGRDLGRGAVVLLAGIIYMIPVIILTAIFIGITAASANSPSGDVDLSFLLVLCGGGFVWLGMLFTLIHSFIVGQIRYASTGSAGALFNIPKNLGVVMSNLGTTMAMIVRWIGISLAFSFFSGMILNVISAFFTNVQLEVIEALTYGDIDGVMAVGMPLFIFISLYYVVSLTIGLMQNFSLAFLAAGYGIELGYGATKLKEGEKSSGTSAALIMLAIVVLIGLFACAIVAMLAVLGPQLGEAFSEIIQETSY